MLFVWIIFGILLGFVCFMLFSCIPSEFAYFWDNRDKDFKWAVLRFWRQDLTHYSTFIQQLILSLRLLQYFDAYFFKRIFHYKNYCELYVCSFLNKYFLNFNIFAKYLLTSLHLNVKLLFQLNFRKHHIYR